MKLQPGKHLCFVCGVDNDAGLHVKFYETETDPPEVHAEFTVPAKYQGFPGFVHGGIIATLLDEVTLRTIFRGNPPRFVVTAKLSVRYRKPVPVETPLKLLGRVEKDKGKMIIVSGEVKDADGAILAEAEAILAEVDSSFFGSAEKDYMQVFVINQEER